MKNHRLLHSLNPICRSRLGFDERMSCTHLLWRSFGGLSPFLDGDFGLRLDSHFSGAINNIYLLSVRYSDQTTSSSPSSSLFHQAASGGKVTVRAGYFGLCAQSGDQGSWICAAGASGLSLILVDGGRNDPLNALGLAERFKSDVVFPGLLIGAMAFTGLAFILLATFPGWHEENDARTGEMVDVRPFPNRQVSIVAFFALAMATVFMLASALWQHVAAASAATLIASTSQGSLSGHVGAAASALAWASFVLVILSCIGILVMILSIRLLVELTDE
nr:hypothetical protein CFP56_26071 [Quercus suber]